MGLGLALTCVVVWLLLSGYFSNPLLLTFGALSCTLVVYLTRRMHLFDSDNPSLGLFFRFLLYLPWLIKEIALSNIDVVRRILSPGLPISPTVVRVKVGQRGDLARVIFANSITLTPGTVSLWLGEDYVEVHALTEAGAEALSGGEMNRRVSAVEGAEAPR